MTDLALLSKDLVAFLAPSLPYLLMLKDKAVEGVGTKIGEDAWKYAKRLWAKLGPKVEANPFAARAAQSAATALADPDALATLRHELKQLLDADPALAGDLAALWAETKAANVTVIASGAGAVAIGGSVTGSEINTGNMNTGR